ncbi:hypothetical protein PV360_37055 [Streptomyces scabiei]|uniref:hypothetical protein n=1 Tax=Streptomyces scabiei TaxID=1930 RepID=UPI0005A09A01|nr:MULTISPECIES: hypothetical protein [Streptomyces]MBP5875692.1 hypothetical protein [Streptomyces sp. LBUM 1477]MDX2652149.1 hypothetical protein [Streptomyces scabiei]MDX2725825.1 hypothetical protein [Streptomyces scabiei]MDX2863944.1 hypothetical protein [Streptomyces scabiei]MDX2881868.1 hypothetical protein [Streptomyces scabiei]
MNVQLNRAITVADYLVQRGLPADWRFGSWLGRVAAEIYRDTYRHEPFKAFRVINDHVRPVCAYAAGESHVLSEAWDRYGRFAVSRPAPAVRPVPPALTSIDAMRWTPHAGPVRSHP